MADTINQNPGQLFSRTNNRPRRFVYTVVYAGLTAKVENLYRGQCKTISKTAREMKRATFMAIMAFILTATQALAGIVIKTTLTIGRKNNNCSGFGLCSVSTSTTYTNGMVNGTLDVNEARGTIILGIYENDLRNVQPDKIVYFNNKSSVVFAEEFQIPDEIKEAVKVTNQLVIKKGEYDMTLKNGKYYIEIPLQ